MAVIFLYFALFLGVHFLSKQFLDKPSGRAERKRPGAARLFQLVACFILLFGFFGFRDITVLNDTSHYYGFYYQKAHVVSYINESILSYHLSDTFEYGFQVLIHFLVKYVSNNPYTIILFSSFLFSLGNVWFLDKYAGNVAISSFVMIISGVYFDQYSMIRQAIAIMLFYVSFGYLSNNENKKYIVTILLASLFHLSTLILLILPLLKKLQICKRNILVIFVSAVVVALFIHTILSVFGMADTFYYKTSVHRSAPPIAALLNGSLMLLLIGICLYLKKKYDKEYDPNIFWICVMGVCISIVTPAFLPFFRLNAYIWPFIYMVVLKYLYTEKSKNILVYLSILLLIRICVILVFKSEWNHVIPYSFYDFSDHFRDYHMYMEKEI